MFTGCNTTGYVMNASMIAFQLVISLAGSGSSPLHGAAGLALTAQLFLPLAPAVIR